MTRKSQENQPELRIASTFTICVAFIKKKVKHELLNFVLVQRKNSKTSMQHELPPPPDFQWVCQELLQPLQVISHMKQSVAFGKRQRQAQIISNFIQLWRTTVGNKTFLNLFLLIFPQWDKRTFYVKDYTLIKVIVQWLHLAKDSATENLLLNWKQIKNVTISKNSNEFVSNYNLNDKSLSQLCVQEISKRRKEPSSHKKLNVKQLNDLLDTLSQERIVNSHKNLVNSVPFMHCLNNMSFLELKFFFDILLKRKILNGLENTFLAIWHPDAKRYLNIVSDLKILTETLFDPTKRLNDNDWDIKVSLPFVPQLTKRVSNESYDIIINKRLNKKFLMEEKMDGERIQLHFQDFGKNINFYSRRGIDYSNLYGHNLSDNGLITRHLNFLSNVRDCILDGEMITYDIENEKILPFGLVKSIASNKNKKNKNEDNKNDQDNEIDQDNENQQQNIDIDNSCYHPLFMIFDLVYLNGTSLVNVPLYQRKEYLNYILRPKLNFVEIIPFQMGTNANSIKNFLARAIEYNSEGIILKNIYSKYMIGKRIDTWIKIKPEYLENFGENMDLVVIGRNLGHKNSFLCALTDLENDKFISFCSIGNGISKLENTEINNRTKFFWKDFKLNPPSENYLDFGTKKPQQWIDPKEFSLVLEIKARSIDNTKSNANRYKVGCTLFSAYCRSIRFDKEWQNCYSINEFENDLDYRSNSKNINHNKSLDETKPPKNKKKKPNKIKIIGNNFIENGSYNIKTTIFTGLKFYILSDYFDSKKSQRMDINQLKKLVMQNGGTLLYNLIIKDAIQLEKLRIISSKKNIECKILIQRGYDIINPRWILDCISNGRLLELNLTYCLHFSPKLLEISRTRVDSMGDSYTTLLNESDLQEIFDMNYDDINIKMEGKEQNSDGLDEKDLAAIPEFLLSNRKVFLPNYCDDNSQNYLLLQKLKLYGASIVPNIDECNLIIILDDQISCVHAIRKKLSQKVYQFESNPLIPQIVNEKWIDKCIEENIQVPEEDFPLI